MGTLAPSSTRGTKMSAADTFSAIVKSIQDSSHDLWSGEPDKASWVLYEKFITLPYEDDGVGVAHVSLACKEEVYAAVNGVPQSHRDYGDVSLQVVSLQVPWGVRKQVIETHSTIDELIMSQVRNLAGLAGVGLQKDLSPFDVRVGYVFQSPHLLDKIREFPLKVDANVPSVIVAITLKEFGSLNCLASRDGLDLRFGVLKPVSPEVFAREVALVTAEVSGYRAHSVPHKYLLPTTETAIQSLKQYAENFFIPMLRQRQLIHILSLPAASA